MIPKWAEKYKTKGTTIKKIGDGYYLYTATSRREPGKKYPVSVQKYLGRITKEGLVDGRRHIQISDTEARHLRDFFPDVGESLAETVLLEVQGEWYFTKIPPERIRELKRLGLYKDEKLVGREINVKERHKTREAFENGE